MRASSSISNTWRKSEAGLIILVGQASEPSDNISEKACRNRGISRLRQSQCPADDGNNQMKVIILAWGSLVWSPRALAITSGFEPNGPSLPLEFSRVSGDGRLTLVIDERSGVPCKTYTAASSLAELETAKENFASAKECRANRE